MNEVVSIILSEFYENNSSQTITTTSTILKKLIRNANNQDDGASNQQQQKDYTTIKLSNPKIQQHIVQVVGALDILGAVGFQQSTINSNSINATQILKYTPPVINTGEGGQQNAVEEHNSLIEAICTNLELKISELNPPTTTSQPPPAWSHESTANSTAKLSSTNSTSPNSKDEFLSNKERQERIQKIKEQKKADRKARELAKQRWNEDSENRKLVQKRKEISMRNEKLVKNEKGEIVRDGEVLDVRVGSVNGGGEGGTNEGGGKKGSIVLPKPFQTAATSLEDQDAQAIRRQLIQETMKDDSLSSKEKQAKIQLLMRGGDNVGNSLSSSGDGAANGNAKVASSPLSSAAMDKKDTAAFDSSKDDKMGMMWKDDERKQPPEAAAAASMMKQAPSTQPINNNLNTTRSNKPTQPSKEWIQFIQQTPRCDSAENIRSTSVFHNKYASSSSSGEDDLAVPNKCLKRLFKELDGLKNDLPSDKNCSIWLRFDEGMFIIVCVAL